MKTLLETVGYGRTDYSINSAMYSVWDFQPSVIDQLVSGVNHDWVLSTDDFLVLLAELKANVSPYCKSFDVIDNGETFVVTMLDNDIVLTVTKNDVLFYEQPIGNVAITGETI